MDVRGVFDDCDLSIISGDILLGFGGMQVSLVRYVHVTVCTEYSVQYGVTLRKYPYQLSNVINELTSWRGRVHMYIQVLNFCICRTVGQ